jgi:long-subunit fatty acid transport protein
VYTGEVFGVLRRTSLIAACLTASQSAYAGGLELPDLGAQALGRGATFTARADDGMALQYNVAGLARQRGTHVLLGGSLVLHQFKFLRAGQYPKTEATPPPAYDGTAYRAVSHDGSPNILPAGVITSDFGIFDRITLGIGLLTPSMVSGRSFASYLTAATTNKAFPSPTALDTVRIGGSLLYPTLGLGVRVTRTLDLGVSASAVLWTLDRQDVIYIDSPDVQNTPCTKPENVACTAQVKFSGKATSFTGAFGAMFRPIPALQLGAQLRLGTSLSADADITTERAAATTGVKAGSKTPATVSLELPWVLRVGARYIKMVKTFEVYDIEVNGTLEGWGSTGDSVTKVTQYDAYRNITATQKHGYENSYSARLGGAYNVDLDDAVLTLRAGGFFDGSSTAAPQTRIDVDSLAKIGSTFGIGYRSGPVAFNAAFAFIASLKRTVSTGDVRPANYAKQGRTVDGKDVTLPAVNNGDYWGATQLLALTVDFAFESLWEQKAPAWGDPRIENLREVSKPSKDKESEEPAKERDRKDDKDAEEKKDTPKADEPVKEPEPKKKKKDPEDPFG